MEQLFTVNNIGFTNSTSSGANLFFRPDNPRVLDVPSGANPPPPGPKKPVIVEKKQLNQQTTINNADRQNSRAPGSNDTCGTEWRVRLSVPSIIQNNTAFGPLAETNNQFIFPFNPSILFGTNASYTQVHPIHVNYPYNAYQNSQIDNITIAGDFFIERESDAAYFLSGIHYLRTMTKMFYGNSSPQGNPPLIARLNGYGNYVLNNIPVVIQSYTMDLGSEIDYIPVVFNGQTNYVPTQALVTVTCLPQYSRRVQSGFSLNTFAQGGYANGGNEGFI